MVLVHSLRNTKTKHDIVVLARNLTAKSRQIFLALGAKVNPLPLYLPVPLPDLLHSNNGTLFQLDKGNPGSQSLPASYVAFLEAAEAFTPSSSALRSCLPFKFSMWAMGQYAKVVFLDAKTLVVENIDDVFARREPTAGEFPMTSVASTSVSHSRWGDSCSHAGGGVLSSSGVHQVLVGSALRYTPCRTFHTPPWSLVCLAAVEC